MESIRVKIQGPYHKQKWFKLFGLKRKLMVLCPDEGFFALHSWATEQEKDKIWAQNGNFLANLKKFKPLRIISSQKGHVWPIKNRGIQNFHKWMQTYL